MRYWKTFMVAAGLAVAATQTAAQEAFPSGRNISFICAFPAGSGADIQVRFLADKMAKVTGQTIIVENKPGAAGNIAATFTASARPDGHTVYVHSGSATAANMHLLHNPPIDVRTDLQAVSAVSKAPFVLSVAADSPFQNVQELVAHLKERGNAASYGSTSTSGKVMGEIFKQRAGLETVEVSYRTAQDAIGDLLSGALEFTTNDSAFALSQEREGRIRILAVSSAERTLSSPQIPTMAEQGVEMNQLGWWGAFVPPGTPEPIINQWNEWFSEVLDDPETVEFFKLIGADVFKSSPQETQDLLIATVDEWEEFVRIADIPKN